MYINAGRLYQDAVQIASTIQSPPSSLQARRESLASILFATMSLEAFINELHHIALEFASATSAPVQLRVLGDLLEEAERSRASIASKYQLAKFILSSQPFDKGASPYQDFALLFDVRNLIVHTKPLEAKLRKDSSGKVVWVEPKIMVRLQNINVLEVTDYLKGSTPEAGELISDLVAEISTQQIALWACRTAVRIVEVILNAIPVEFAAITNTFYRKQFSTTTQP